MSNFDNALNKMKDELSFKIYGMSRSEALAQGICVSCKQPPTFTTEAGKKEYPISALCEPCWDKIFKEN